MRIRSSFTPGRRGALPQAPDIEGDYDYTKHDFPLWWASIRLPDLIKIAQAKGPKIWTTRLALAEGHWQAFLRERAEVSARLRRTDWSQVPATDLVAFTEGAAAIRIGIGALPREYAGLSFAARSVLYLRTLVLWGTLRGGPFPLHPALEAVGLHQGAPYAVTEMFRRGSKHVGIHMFLLLISHGEATVEKALEGLRKATYGLFKKRPKRRHYIAETLDRVLGTGRGPAASFRQEMDAQAFRTGKKRWGALGPRGLTLRWLAGKLNIAPAAIADDLHDAARTLMRRLGPEVSLDEKILPHVGPPTAQIEARLELERLAAAARLSTREAEVFAIVAPRGGEHGAISVAAKRLGIKPTTARVHWSNAWKKVVAAADR